MTNRFRKLCAGGRFPPTSASQRASEAVPGNVRAFRISTIQSQSRSASGGGAVDDVLIAGLLHDVIEYTAATEQDVLEQFGARSGS